MDFRLPELGEGVYEAELVAWQVKPGDTVKRGQTLMEVLTDKATMEVPAPFGGVIEKLSAQPGQVIKVGDTVLSYKGGSEKDGEPAAEDHARVSEKNNIEQKRRADNPVALPVAVPRMAASRLGIRAAPSVRFMARKLGVDLAKVHGSGPGGRVLLDDLSPHLQTSASPARPPVPDSTVNVGKPGTHIKL